MKSRNNNNRFGLAAKLNLMTLVLVGFTACALTLFQIHNEKTTQLKTLIEQGEMTSEWVAKFSHYALYSEDEVSLATLLDSFNNENSTYLALYRADKTLLASRWYHAQDARVLITPNTRLSTPIFDREQRHITFFEPVLSAKTSALDGFSDELDSEANKQDLLGYVYLVLNTAQMEKQIKKALWTSLLMTLTIVFFAIILSIILAGKITRPIAQLVHATKKIAEGNLTDQVSVNVGGELKYLAVYFNRMIKQLNSSRLDLIKHQQTLELRVKQRTEELECAKEVAEAASSAKSDFLATMSHEIRTPLNGMLGMAELLSATPLNDRQSHFTQTIRSSGDALLSIINDILDFSKIESGKLALESNELDLRELIEQTTELYAEPARKKHLKLIADLPLEQILMVEGDGTRLRQILLNLISNSIKFTEKGEVIIKLVKSGQHDGKATFCFQVSDSGIGMTKQQQGVIFESFLQADNSTTRKFGGTGLGLAISARLVTLLGGELTVSSELGKGSTFQFSLVLPYLEKASIKAAHKDELIGKRVLIVDDNITNREVLFHQLTGWGAIADSAECGTTALQMFQQAQQSDNPYHLALLDWRLPDMNGIQLTRQILAHAIAPAPYLVMLSCAQSDLVSAQALQNGIHRYLNKPVKQQVLLDCLLTVFNQKNITHAPLTLANNKSPSQALAPLNAKILLAEDNPVNQQVAIGLLQMLGCEVVVVENGELAVTRALNNTFDLILMDCHMPVKDGFSATSEIRKQMAQRPNVSQASYVPIVALTADVQQTIQQQCQAAGMDDYLSKPFNKELLHAKLVHWLTPDKRAEKVVALQSETSSDKQPEASKQSQREPLKIAAQSSETEPPAAAIDHQLLEVIRAMQPPGMPNILNQVIDIYLESSATLIEFIGLSVSKQDIDSLFDAAHSLKSSSANLGATHVASTCKQLEALVSQGSIEPAEALFKQLLIEYATACFELKKMLRE